MEGLAFLQERLSAAGISYEAESSAVREDDWANNWKQYFKPCPIGEKLLIVPSWEKDAELQVKYGDRVHLVIDPGMAFGSGQHETTRLCMELIEKYDIETQDELAQKLCEEGFMVTQATVSRDIREMKLTKIATERGKQKYSVITGNDTEITERLTRVFKEAVVKMDYAQNIIVVKTLEGMGMAVAVALDNMQNTEILGTIAGDDTVFCVVRTHNQAAVIIEKLYRIIHSA